MKSVWDNILEDVRFWIGLALMGGGTIAASYFYPVAKAHPSNPNFAETFFDYALFTVAIGALSVLFKLYVDKTEAWKKARESAVAAARDRRLQEARDLREFRGEIIENYTAMKAFRRGILIRGNVDLAGEISVPREAFFDLVSAFNDEQHRLESIEWRMHLDHRFLRGDEERVREILAGIRGYTHEVIDACKPFDAIGEGPVAVTSGPLWDFLQPNLMEEDDGGPNTVNTRFFKPHYELRTLLFARIHQQEAGVFLEDRE